MTQQVLTAQQRQLLRRLLVADHPWLDEVEYGPRAVDAGDCDRCGLAPRLLPTCGPVAWPALCRTCAADVGDDAWCDGHRSDGQAARDWAGTLPDDWDAVVRCWWVATGEIGLDPALLERPAVARMVRSAQAALGESGP